MSLIIMIEINESITELQTMNDINSEVRRLSKFLDEAVLSTEDNERLRKILDSLNKTNEEVKTTVHQVMNKLNKLYYY